MALQGVQAFLLSVLGRGIGSTVNLTSILGYDWRLSTWNGLTGWRAWGDSKSGDVVASAGQFRNAGLIVDGGWQLKGQFGAGLVFLQLQDTVRRSGFLTPFEVLTPLSGKARRALRIIFLLLLVLH